MDSQEENKVRPLNLKLQVNVHPQAEWLCRNRLTGALKWNYFRLLHSNLGQKRLFGEKKKAQGTSDLPCFSHWNLPLVWLMMCLNQRSVRIARILVQIKPHLEGAGKALAELLKISCLKEGFFLLRVKEIFSEQGNFLSAWEKISLKSCCFCFLLITSINLAKVEWGDD